MKLREYIEKEIPDLKITDLAKKIGFNRTYLNGIFSGRHLMELRVAKLLEYEFGGKFTAEELMAVNKAEYQRRKKNK